MAEQIPDALVRRDILYGSPKRTPNFSALGQAYRDAGRLSDACEAFELVEDEAESLKWIKVLQGDAIKAGNAFLLGRTSTSVDMSPEDWQLAGENARKLGKLNYALKIAVRLGNEDLVKELKQELGIEIEPPPGEGDETAEGEDADAGT